MPHEELHIEPLPPFVRLRTTPDMSKVAVNLVKAEKAIKEIAKIENRLLKEAETLSEADFKMAMKEQKQFADIVTDAAGNLIKISQKVRKKVESYRKDLQDALD